MLDVEFAVDFYSDNETVIRRNNFNAKEIIMALIYDKENKTWHGVRREARRLNVSQGHLSMVLNGKRKSKRLMRRVKIVEVK